MVKGGSGVLADAAIALNVILSRLYWGHKKLPIPGLYDKVRKLTAAEKRAFRKLPGDEAKWRSDNGVLDGVEMALENKVHPNEATWRKPAITVIVTAISLISWGAALSNGRSRIAKSAAMPGAIVPRSDSS